MLFAQLNMNSIPENLDLRENPGKLLRNLDAKCILSLNGMLRSCNIAFVLPVFVLLIN